MNLHTDKPGFRDSRNFDYHLTKESPAIDAGGWPDETASELLIPTHEYVHSARASRRVISGPIDLGAFEYRSPWLHTAVCHGWPTPDRTVTAGAAD